MDAFSLNARRGRRGLIAASVVLALLGGVVAVALLFAGLGLGAVAIGLAVTFTPASLLAAGRNRRRAGGVLLGYSFAFAMLTWPLLWFLALAIWGFGE